MAIINPASAACSASTGSGGGEVQARRGEGRAGQGRAGQGNYSVEWVLDLA